MGQIWATLDRFEDDKAVLILPDGQNIVISRKNLDQNLKAGDMLAINFAIRARQTVKKEKIAQKLLNKILKQKS